MSKPTNISDDEWQVRCDLAACYRLFVKFGWTDLIFTHLSARVPGTTDQYLINPFGLLFDEITASNLIKVDFDGNVVEGEFPFNQAGHAIHTAVLSARPEINVALHSHTRAGAAVSGMGEGLLPLSQHAMEVIGLTCYHPYSYSVDSVEECRRLSHDLGDKWLMIMHNHGLLAAGRTVAEAFYYLYILEAACKIQVDILSASANPIIPDDAAVQSLTKHTQLPTDGPHEYVNVTWDAMIRSLHRSGTQWIK